MADTDYASLIRTEQNAYTMRDEIASGIEQAQNDASIAVNTSNNANNTANTANDRVNNIVTNNPSGTKDQELIDFRHSNITNTTYATAAARGDALDSQLAEKASQISLETQKSRIDNLIQTSSSSFYEKCLQTDTGALLVVSSGAIAGQINLMNVTPVASGYTPQVGDYVRLVYGVASGNTELIDSRVNKLSQIFSNVNSRLLNTETLLITDRENIFTEVGSSDGFLKQDGTVGTATGWKYTDYLSVKPGDALQCSISNGSGNCPMIIMYDINKNLIGQYTGTNELIPETAYVYYPNTAFVRYNYNPSVIANNYLIRIKDGITKMFNSTLREEMEKTNSYNAMDFNTVQINYLLSKADGTAVNNSYSSNWIISGFFRVDGGDTIYIPYVNVSLLHDTSSIAYYNKNQKFIGYTMATKDGEFEAIASYGAYYARVQFPMMSEYSIFREYIKITKHSYINEAVTHTISMKADGTGDFTTLGQAIKSITDSSENNRYIIELSDGTYDMSDIISNLPTNFGIFLPPYVDIKGIGNRDATIIKGEVPDDYNNSSVTDNVSTLNIIYTNTIENVTITAKNLRYAVHSDENSNYNGDGLTDAHRVFINCKLIHYGVKSVHTYYAPAAWGGGSWDGTKEEFINCEFIAYNFCGWLNHNRPGLVKGQRFYFENCKFINIMTAISNDSDFVTKCHANASVVLNSWGDGLKDKAIFIGCTATAPLVMMEYQSSGKIDYEVEGSGNNLPVEFKTTTTGLRNAHTINFADETEQVLNNTASIIALGTPVKHSAIIGVEPMTIGDDLHLFYGIAYEDIAVGQLGTIKTNNHIALSDIGLSSANRGDKVTIANGAFVVDNSAVNYIGVVINESFMKLI